MKMRRPRYIYVFLTLILQSVCVSAQTSKVLEEMRRGDSLRENYRFAEASEVYLSASEMFVDSLMTTDDSLLKLDVSDRLLMAENGLSMMDFVYTPEVVARHKFSVDDFFLYYPLPEYTWRLSPSQLDSTAHDYSKASYVPEGKRVIYWSAADKEGIRNIFHSTYQDTV